MATTHPENPDHSGRLVETHRGYNPRIILFYFIIAGMLLLLAGGLAYQQIFLAGTYRGRERQQNERRVLLPGPRGNIYDREGRLLVGNRPRFALVLYLEGLQPEFRREFIRIRNNYRDTGDRDLPTADEMENIARVDVVQRYLDQVNDLLGRHEQVDAKALRQHFRAQLLLPYTLIPDLSPDEFARLTERLPVQSPLQVTATSARTYPYGSAASHVLGYVSVEEDLDAQDFPGGDLTTFKLKGSVGRDGLEKRYDAQLQGEAGGEIFRVDPAGFKINPPLERRLPLQGKSLTTSLDIDLQQAAEQAIGDQLGAAVAIDVRTGEVLVLASKPDYNLNDFSPRLDQATVDDIQKRGAWTNLAISGLLPPGSTFKTLVTIAGLTSGKLDPDDRSVDCEGSMRIGNRIFHDDGGEVFGKIDLREAITVSSDVYFWTHGLQIGPDIIAAEARRFHLDRPTGIELPGETHHMIIPDPAWKKRERGEAWTDGDTANLAIGQGQLEVTPLEMACYAASVARNEITTQPTLLHDPNRPLQHSEPIGLTPQQRAVLIDGMVGCVSDPQGTARTLALPAYAVPGVSIAGKTGTAQMPGHVDMAWFICFAPAENPEIAVAVAIKGETAGEAFQGGLYAAPVASSILKLYFAKKAQAAGQSVTVR